MIMKKYENDYEKIWKWLWKNMKIKEYLVHALRTEMKKFLDLDRIINGGFCYLGSKNMEWIKWQQNNDWFH